MALGFHILGSRVEFRDLGASTVKWTTHDPWLVLSESGSKLYTDFEFCKEENHRHYRNILIYKAKQFRMTKTIPRKVYIFYGTSGVQLGDIEQAIV